MEKLDEEIGIAFREETVQDIAKDAIASAKAKMAAEERLNESIGTAFREETVQDIAMDAIAKAKVKMAFKDKIHRIKVWGYSTASAIAVAACSVFGYISQVVYTSIGMNQQLVCAIAKGGEEPDYIKEINAAKDYADAKDYDAALDALSRAESMLTDDYTVNYELSEDGLQRIKVLDASKESIEFNRATIYARQGKVFKSRKVLKHLANNGTYYQKQAQAMLDDMNNLRKRKKQ